MKPCMSSEQCSRQRALARTHLERVTSVCFAVDHLHDILVHLFAGLVTISPVVPCTDPLFADVEVFGVVNVLVGTGLDAVDDLCGLASAFWSFLRSIATHSWLKVNQDGSRNVSGVVALVVKYVFSVAALGRKVFEVAILADAVLLAELLPELAADCASSAPRNCNGSNPA